MSMAARLAAVFLGVWVAVALLAPALPLEPDAIVLSRILASPGTEGWLGFDDLGRPIADRLAVGARVSLTVAIAAVGLSAAVGTAIGVIAGWLGGAWDQFVVRVIDVFLAFPGILLAIALAGLLGAGLHNVVIALAAVGWVGFARLARAQTLSLRRRDHVTAAIALGRRPPAILLRHVLPLVAAPLVVEASFAIAAAVVAEAGLSFLGLGVQPPQASWGSMIRDGTRYMLVAPHMVLAPGAALMIVVLSINLLGDALRDRLDVRATARRESK